MAKLKAALIATGFMPADMDSFEALEKLAAMGYKGYELAMMARGMKRGENGMSFTYTEDEALAKLKELGMAPLTVGMNADAEGNYDIKKIIEDAHKQEVNRATVMVSSVANYRFGRFEERRTYDEAMDFVEKLEAAAVELKKEGIITAFHNHDEEFIQCYKGVPYYYLMAANSDVLKFELDTGWCTYAGFNPIQVMKQLGDRLCAIHIKDFADGGVEQVRPARTITMPRFTTPGTGHLDLKGCLQQGIESGMDYAIIEQDFMYNLSPLDTAQAGYYNMKETGLVE